MGIVNDEVLLVVFELKLDGGMFLDLEGKIGIVNLFVVILFKGMVEKIFE